MASKPKRLSDFLHNPDIDYCVGRLLSLANELSHMGYKPRIISKAALNVALHHSKEGEIEEYAHFLRLIEGIGRDGLTQYDRLAEEHEKAGILTEN